MWLYQKIEEISNDPVSSISGNWGVSSLLAGARNVLTQTFSAAMGRDASQYASWQTLTAAHQSAYVNESAYVARQTRTDGWWQDHVTTPLEVNSAQGQAIRSANAASYASWAEVNTGFRGFLNATGKVLRGAGEGAYIGAVANVNAAADTVVSTLTLGQRSAGELIGVSDWMRSDYGASYAIARGGYELLTGVGTAGLANLKGAGTGLRVAGNVARFYDAAGNAVTFAEGATGVYNDGLNWQNAAQLAGGALGLRGNFADFSLVRDPSIVGTPLGSLRIHKNSHAYVGDTHVYVLEGPADLYVGGVNKVGQSAQGVRVRDGASIRGETQARRLTRETGRFHQSRIVGWSPDKVSGKTYERQVRDQLRERLGPGSLPGNRERY